MRVRLFTLLVVPAAAAMVLAGMIVVERSARYEAAKTAFSVARLADDVAALDKALGEEALASSELVESAERVSRTAAANRFADTSAATDRQLARIEDRLRRGTYHPQLHGAASAVRATLAFRSDVTAGIVSPLQTLDRYSHIRSALLDALTAEALLLSTTGGQQHILALVDLIEARSAHLDERVAVGLARRYQEWAPGLHSEVVMSVTDQNGHLENANRFLFGDVVEPPAALAEWRKEISISDAAPRIDARTWSALSDSWLAQLDDEIGVQRTRTMDLLAHERSSAESTQLATIVGVSVAVLVAMLLASVLSVRLVRRVSIITQQARAMAAGRPTRRTSPEVRGADELGQLASAFDEMTTQIETRTRNQWIESSVLESIVQGASIDEVMRRTALLLGTDDDGEPRYEFVTDPDGEVRVASRSAPAGHQTGDRGTAGDRGLAGDGGVAGPAAAGSTVAAIDAPEFRTALGLVTMARQRDADHQQLAWQANRDGLTGLLNRGAILGRALAVAEPPPGAPTRPAFLYLDLDGFKTVNDQFGHSAGDRVLSAQAERLEGLVVERGGVAGRLGGDEFLLVLPAVGDDGELRRFAERLVEELSQPVAAGDRTFQVGASVGAVLTRPDVPALKLLNDADAALYQAKRQGRGQALVSTQALRDHIVEADQLRRDVQQALTGGQLEPWFQPIWGDRGASLVGLEALIRWPHPERGLVPPAVFLPVADELNLLADLDRMMFEAVCHQVAAWRATGLHLEMVHYNLSTAWLEQPAFVGDTTRILRETGCPPQAIVAEVTESGLMTDISSNSHRLQELREVGIRIAVDDFGQGYSSLAYLSDLPVDLLKIDRRFVDHIDREESNQAIVSAVLNLGQSLGLTIIAEGVERPEELDYLNRVECDLFQGFLLSRPLPVEEATALLGRARSPLADRRPAGAGPRDRGRRETSVRTT